MIKNTLYKIFVVGSLSIFSIACSKFDQDFTTKAINELTIDATETSYTLVQFEKLNIPVSISASQQASGNYSYTWKAIASDKTYIISTEKDLNTTIELSPGTYNLQYTVKDLENGLEFNKLFSLTVNGAFYSGWLVSHNQANKGKLSFVRSDYTVFSNPGEEINTIQFEGKSVGAFYTAIRFYNQYASINYFTDKGVYRFDPNDFKLTGKTENVIPNKTSFGSVAYGATLIGADQYFVIDGKVHAGMGSFYADQILMPYSEGFTGDYDIFPAVITTPYLATYFYDNKAKRFMQVPYLERELSPISGSNAALFNLGNVGKTMIAADKGRAGTTSGIYYFVMEDADGRYFYAINNTSPSYAQKVENTKCPEFSEATSFATSVAFEHMYYVVNNKIYLYNMVANAAELLYTFPSGYKIKDIQIDKSTSKSLAVGTVNNGSGELHLFDINDIGHFVNNKPSRSITGFGEIVHINIK